MASVKRHRRTKYWIMCIRNADGRRVNLSSGEEDKNTALMIATMLQDVAEQYRRRKRNKGFLRRGLNRIAASVGCEIIDEYTTRRWFNFWVDNKENSQATGTGKRYKALVRDFLKHLKSKADDDLSELESVDIQSFLDALHREGLSTASLNLALKTIRGSLNAAVAQGHIQFNRADAIDLIPKEEGIKEAFNRSEVELLLTTTNDIEWYGLILFAYFIGARLGDCTRFVHEAIDYVAKTLKYKPTKQKRSAEKKEIVIPIHPELMAYFESLGVRSGPVFPRLSRMRVEGESGLSLTFRELMDKAGIKYAAKPPAGKKGRVVYSLGFHSLRKSFNSDLANAGVSQEIRQRIIGHASKEVNDVYTHLDLEIFRTAINCLKSLSVPPPTKGAGKTPRA
jgi:integrase